MSTCAQNQSNQDEDGAPEQGGGSGGGPGESGHDAVQHFLSTSSTNAANSRTNGLGSQPPRNMQQVIIFVYLLGTRH